MSTPSLRTRIRNVSLLLVVLVIGLGLYALPRVYRLGARFARRSIATTSASRPHSTCTRRCESLQLAERDGHARDVLPELPRHLHALDGYREP